MTVVLNQTKYANNIITIYQSPYVRSWNNINKLMGESDGVCASCHTIEDHPQIIKMSDFRFTIPDDASIKGFTIRLTGQCDRISSSKPLVKIWSTGFSGNEGEFWDTSLVTQELGDNTDLWGLFGIFLSPNFIRRTTFSIYIYHNISGGGDFLTSLDAVEVTIYYEPQILTQIRYPAQARVIEGSGDADWVDSGNICGTSLENARDGNSAYVVLEPYYSSQQISAYNFLFHIPMNAIITGIYLRAFISSATNDNYSVSSITFVYYDENNNITGFQITPSLDTWATVADWGLIGGGSDFTGGKILTPQILMDSRTSIIFSVADSGSGVTNFIDCFELTCYYYCPDYISPHSIIGLYQVENIEFIEI